MLLTLLMLLLGLAPAHADPQATRDALDRLEEVLELRLQDGRLRKQDVLPALLVSTRPRYVGSEGWFTTRAIEVLQGAFGTGSLRLCEACMVPRGHVGEGTLVYQSGPVGLDEIVLLDTQLRGPARAARSAIWIDETARGVTIRIVDLRNGNVLLARNVDPDLRENARSQRTYQLAAELERRARGDSLTQAFVDVAVFPSQHISFDWTDQFGARNQHLAGFTISLFDPVVGLGGNYAFATPIFDTLVGGKLIVSLPTALVRAVGGNAADGVDIVDPLLTGVFTVRVPIGRSNYGVLATASTNGRIGFGISLLNISPIPVLP